MGLKSHQVNVQRMLPNQVLAGSVAAHVLTQTVKSFFFKNMLAPIFLLIKHSALLATFHLSGLRFKKRTNRLKKMNKVNRPRPEGLRLRLRVKLASILLT